MLKLHVYTTTPVRNLLILNNAFLNLFFSGESLLNMLSHLVFNTVNHQDSVFSCLYPIAFSLLPLSLYFAFYCICNLLTLIRVALPKVSQGG